jgi:hypothetical protein
MQEEGKYKSKGKGQMGKTKIQQGVSLTAAECFHEHERPG